MTILMLISGAIFLTCGFVSINATNDTVQQICTIGRYAAGPLALVSMLFVAVLVFIKLFKKK